jgi:hypothetical protein
MEAARLVLAIHHFDRPAVVAQANVDVSGIGHPHTIRPLGQRSGTTPDGQVVAWE